MRIVEEYADNPWEYEDAGFVGAFHAGSFEEAMDYALKPDTRHWKIALVRDAGDRSCAYLEQGRLDGVFADGAKVPQRFIEEVENYFRGRPA